MGCIYRILCYATGKTYIGQTSFSHPFIRFQEHQKHANEGKLGSLYDDLRTYGIHEFECSCLRFAKNEDLNELECYYAEQYDAYEWMGGYNIIECGTAKVREEMSDDKRLYMKRRAIRTNYFRKHH